MSDSKLRTNFSDGTAYNPQERAESLAMARHAFHSTLMDSILPLLLALEPPKLVAFRCEKPSVCRRGCWSATSQAAM